MFLKNVQVVGHVGLYVGLIVYTALGAKVRMNRYCDKT